MVWYTTITVKFSKYSNIFFHLNGNRSRVLVVKMQHGNHYRKNNLQTEVIEKRRKTHKVHFVSIKNVCYSVYITYQLSLFIVIVIHYVVEFWTKYIISDLSMYESHSGSGKTC